MRLSLGTIKGMVLAFILWLAALLGEGVCPNTASGQEELFVANSRGDSITVYDRTAGDNTAPIRTLSGAATGLNDPSGLVVDTVNDELVVANGDSITVYNRTASGNATPIRTLSVEAFSGFLAVDPVNNELVMTNQFVVPYSVVVYNRTATSGGWVSPGHWRRSRASC